MPLPFGHIAIGLATHEVGTTRSAFSRWKLFAAIVVLSNLPDIDVIIGLLFQMINLSRIAGFSPCLQGGLFGESSPLTAVHQDQ